MRKHLIGTILVLAALTACNKEVETPAPAVDNGQEEATPGKVTLTFTAAIGDDTRTAYDDEQKPDQKARWVIGDKITVCVSNGDESNPDFKLFDFTATTQSDNNLIFSGEVVEGYTTIVSGIYPARTSEVQTNGEVTSNHSFSNGMVSQVYLPDSYSLGSSNDLGDAIPMVGKIENGAFTFRHICGALKIEVVDIFNSLTFTTSGQTITGDFELDGNGRINIPENGSTSTVTFNYDRLSTNPDNGERGNRTFYIPVPYGTLTAGATMELKTSDGTTAFEKSTSGAISISNVIKRMSVIGLNEKTSNSWRIIVSSADPGQKGSHSHYVPTGTSFIQTLMPLETFNNTYHGSVAEFIEANGLSNKVYSKSTKFATNNTIDHYYGKTYVALTCEVINNDERRVLFNYSKLTYEFDDPATADYSYWLGEWNVYDNVSSTPKQDHWTIERLITNSSFLVKGLFNGTYSTYTIECEALLEGCNMKFLSQKVKETSKYQYFLLGSTNQAADRIEGEGHDIMTAQKDGDNSAYLHPIDPVKRYYLILYNVSDNSYYGQSGYRLLTSPAPMTRITE